jgi:hypothetical protein
VNSFEKNQVGQEKVGQKKFFNGFYLTFLLGRRRQ